jgi:hypothetical protein
MLFFYVLLSYSLPVTLFFPIAPPADSHLKQSPFYNHVILFLGLYSTCEQKNMQYLSS